MDKIRIMSIAINIDTFTDPPQYRAIFRHPGGRIFRRLGITPSPGAFCEKGVIQNEQPHIAAQAYNKASIISNELGDSGAFSVRGKYLFADAMNEFIKWHEQYRNNPKLKGHAKPVIERFGDKRLNAITRTDVRKWINEMAENHSHNTVRNRVAPGKQLYNWMIKEARYDGPNPFESHEWRADKRRGIHVKPVITPEEWTLINNVCDDSYLTQALVLAYHTGLRPSEVYRIGPDDFDHDQLTLKVRVQKTGEYTRLIAIPAALSVWAINHEWRTMQESTIQGKMLTLKSKHPSLNDLSMASFRKSFAAVMEQAGADHEAINAHQGRGQYGVIQKHYLTDKYRAVRLMRPFINTVFDGGKVDILRKIN